MEITVDVTKLESELQKSFETYKKSRVKALELYVTKVQEYATYCKRQLDAGKPIEKPAPYLHQDYTSNFEERLEALNLHTLPSIVLKDDELREIKQGQRQWMLAGGEAVEELASINYAGTG